MSFGYKSELFYGINQIQFRCYKVSEKLSNFKVEDKLRQPNGWKGYFKGWHLMFGNPFHLIGDSYLPTKKRNVKSLTY